MVSYDYVGDCASYETICQQHLYMFSLSFRVAWVYLTVGIWVYPILGLFSSSGLTGFFFFNMLVLALLYLLGQTLNRKVWGEKRAESYF